MLLVNLKFEIHKTNSLTKNLPCLKISLQKKWTRSRKIWK